MIIYTIELTLVIIDGVLNVKCSAVAGIHGMYLLLCDILYMYMGTMQYDISGSIKKNIPVQLF